jgi:hypothetical protein
VLSRLGLTAGARMLVLGAGGGASLTLIRMVPVFSIHAAASAQARR